jgi:hypothetical protein
VAVALLMCTSKAADGGRARPLAATSTFSSVRQNITRSVAFSLVPLSDEGGGGVEAVPGEVRKRSEPVFMMDKPWETNVNNGYSSVLYDPEDAFGLGRFRAFYSASDGGFGAADCPPGECGAGSATLVANSTDGISWEKPRLGLFAWSSSKKNRGTLSNATTPLPCCTLCPPGACPCPFCGHAAASETNILFEDTTAVAIFDDGAHELNASRRFKVCMTTMHSRPCRCCIVPPVTMHSRSCRCGATSPSQ